MTEARFKQIERWGAILRCSTPDDPGLPLSIERGVYFDDDGAPQTMLAICINEEGPVPIAHVLPSADADEPSYSMAEAIAEIGLGVYELIAEIHALNLALTSTQEPPR